MNKLLIVFFLSCACAFSQSRQTIYFEDFEQGDIPPNWTEWNPVEFHLETWEEGVSPIAGTNSIRFSFQDPLLAIGALYYLPQTYDDVKIHYLFKTDNYVNKFTEIIDFYDQFANEIGDTFLSSDGRLELTIGPTTGATSASIPSNTVVNVWFHYINSPLGTTTASAAWSTNSTEPTSGTQFVSKSDGQFHNPVFRILFGLVTTSNLNFYYDNFEVSVLNPKTYYVSKSGSDAGSGSALNPWLSVSHALTNVADGDTVKFSSGNWYELLSSSVPNVTWDGQSVATLSRMVTFNTNGNKLLNFDVGVTNRVAPYIVTLKLGAHYSTISNCYLHVLQGVGTNGPATADIGGVSCEQGPATPFDSTEASNCRVVNSYFNLLSAERPAFEMKGTNNLFQACVCTNFYQGNCIYLYGKYHVIRNNLFHQTALGANYGSHPDWVQYFGFLGNGSIGHVLEGNIVSETGSPGQLTRGNFPTDPLASDKVTGALHGGWVFRNNIFLNEAQIFSAIIPNLKWINNTFYRCDTDAGHAISAIEGPNGCSEGVVILNNEFIDCGTATASNQCWYAIGDVSGVTVTNYVADYNYVAKNDWGPAQTAASPTGFRFKEAHMINGGDPLIAFNGPTNNMNFRLAYSSPLVNAGTNYFLSTNTIDGMTRPLGSSVDIGPYEADTNLLALFDFNQPQTNYIRDVTGNGHNAYQMDSTNWITFQGGYGQWTKIGIINNNGTDYDLSQYAAITNITGLDFITNGTISARVAWGSDTLRFDSVLDSGDLVAFAPTPSTSTNAWALSWGWPDLAVSTENEASGAIFRKWPVSDYSDTNTVLSYWNNHPHNGNWNNMVVTWNAGLNSVVTYFNGVATNTNSMNSPYLRVASPKNWICVGAMQHSGTPQWDTPGDKFPNSGFFKGKMDDIRIYNRTLSAPEVSSLNNAFMGTVTATLTPTPAPVQLRITYGKISPPPPPETSALAQRFGGTGADIGRTETVDSSGNIYVAGTFSGSFNFGTTTLTSAGGLDLFLAKFNSSRVLQWVKSYGSTGDEIPQQIVLGTSGNIYVGGQFSGTASFGGSATVSAGSTDGFIAKYSSSGTFVWSRTVGGTGADQINGIALDATESKLLAIGMFTGTVTFTATNTFSSQSGGNDSFLAGYTTAVGSPIWAKTWGSIDYDTGLGVFCDANNNVFVMGAFASTLSSDMGSIQSYPGTRDLYIAKFLSVGTSAPGAATWSRRYGSLNNTIPTCAALDRQGNVVVGGTFVSQTDMGNGTMNGTGSLSTFLAKYSGVSGAHIWSRSINSTLTVQPNGIVCDTNNHPTVCGIYTGTCNFGIDSFTDVGSGDVFVAKYHTSGGSSLLAQTFGGTGTDSALSIAVDVSNQISSVGFFSGTASFGDDTLISAGDTDIFLMKVETTPQSVGDCIWSKDFGGNLISTDTVNSESVKEDHSGNVLVAGRFRGTVNFGAGDLTSAGDNDIFMLKYNSVGTLQWQKRFGNFGDDAATSIAIDSSDNIILSGYYTSTVDFGGTSLTNAGSLDIFVAKYSTTGTLVWAKRFGGTGGERCNGVVLDSANNILITGFYGFNGTAVDFGGGPLPLPAGPSAITENVFVTKLSSSGGYLWANGYGSASANFDSGNGISVDGSGNALIVGTFAGGLSLGGNTLTNAGGSDIFVAKYSSSSGTHLWSNRGGGSGNDLGKEVAVDSNGNVIITGDFVGTATIAGITLSSTSNPTASAIFLAKYSTLGAGTWAKGFVPLPLSGASGSGVAVDGSGNIFLTGYSQGTVEFGGGHEMSTGSKTILLAKASGSNGSISWVTGYGGASIDNFGEGITIGSGNNILLTGLFGEPVNFGCGSMTSVSRADGFVLKIAP